MKYTWVEFLKFYQGPPGFLIKIWHQNQSHYIWHLGTAKSKEKLAENLEISSKTASFPSFLNGWRQKISGFRNCSDFCQKFLKKSVFFFFFNLKFFKIQENKRTSLNIAAKLLVFPTFVYLFFFTLCNNCSWC